MASGGSGSAGEGRGDVGVIQMPFIAMVEAEIEAAAQRSYPKKYESLEEFRDYLNTHESWEWRNELNCLAMEKSWK